MDGGKRLVFLGLWGATFACMFGDTIPQSFQPLFLASLGISPAAIGLVYNIRNVVQTFLRLFAGGLSDALGRRRVIMAGLALITLVPFMYAASTDLWLPLAAMFVSGVGQSIFFPPVESYASSLYPPEQAGKAMGRFHTSWAMSSVLGPAAGGFLALAYPDYRSLFLLAGVVTGTSLIIFRVMAGGGGPERVKPVSAGALIRGFPATLQRMSRNRRVVAGSLSVFVHAFCHWGIPAYLPLYAAGLGLNEAAIGLALTANALVYGAAMPLVGSVSDRIGRFPPVIVGVAGSVAVFALFPSATSVYTLVATNAALGLCAALEFPISQALTMEALPEEERGTAAGVWGMMMNLGGTLGLFGMSFIVSTMPLESVFYFCAVFSLISAVVLVAMWGYFSM